MIRKYRTPESVKQRIDRMLKKGSITLCHGCGSYEFDHYDYYEANVSNNFKSMLIVYYKDFDANKSVKEYMRLTEDNLREPTKDDLFKWFVSCYWEKEYPSLLSMKEYEKRY